MKKTLSIVLSMAMLSSLFAFSANAVAPAADISKMSVEMVAHMDLDSASPATKEAILAARNEIIYGDQAWTVNGAVTLIDLENGTEEKIPEFSELFPGWDVPTVEVDPGQAALEEYFLTNGVPKASYYKEPYNIFLNLGSSFAASPRFATVFGTGDPVACYGYAGPVNGRFNLGFSTGGKELGWVPNRSVEQQQGAKIATTNGLVYDVRASASNPESVEWYTLVVTNDPEITDRYL